jgi:sulfatase maturation enzyme AslB (radical SAM superfamily)
MENNIQDNKVFCIMPWTHLAVRTSGAVSPCSWGVKPSNDIFDEKYNVSNYPNIEYIEDLKKNMLAGEKSDFCTRCYEQESLCGISQRTNETFKSQKEETIKVLNGESVSIQELELRLGNMCNIGCISCSPLSSNYFIREIEKHQPDLSKFDKKVPFHFNMLKEKELNWFKNKDFWKKLENHLPNIKYIYLAGGEPTIIKENWDFLEKVVEQGYSKNIKLGISTNLTNVNSKHIEIYNSFKSSMIYCSIDGIEEINDYIRYPSKWQQVSKNLNLLLTNTNECVEIKVVPVISSLSVWRLPDLWDYVKDLSKIFDKKIMINSHTILRDPSWLAIQNLPDEAKKEIIVSIEELLKKYPTNELRKLLTYLKNSMKQGNVDNFYEGKGFIEQYESMRGNSWKQVFPELLKYWS